MLVSMCAHAMKIPPIERSNTNDFSLPLSKTAAKTLQVSHLQRKYQLKFSSTVVKNFPSEINVSLRGSSKQPKWTHRHRRPAVLSRTNQILSVRHYCIQITFHLLLHIVQGFKASPVVDGDHVHAPNNLASIELVINFYPCMRSMHLKTCYLRILERQSPCYRVQVSSRCVCTANCQLPAATCFPFLFHSYLIYDRAQKVQNEEKT